MANHHTDRDKAVNMLDSIRENFGTTDYDMLNHIMYNYLSGTQAKEALEDIIKEFGIPYKAPKF